MKYDFIVIGGGSAGLVAAKFATGLGKKTAIVEAKKLGGDCTHFGCIPSKTLLKSANIANSIKNIQKYGLDIDASKLDTSGAFKHVRDVVRSVYAHELPEDFVKSGIDIISGHAVFQDNNTIIVSDKTYTADKLLISTGSSPLIPDIKGLSDIDYLTNENIFDLEDIPESVAVIGAGPIGIELASALNGLGVDVAVIEFSSQILPREDKELSDMLAEKLIGDGLHILTGTSVESVKQCNGYVLLKTKGQVDEVKAVRVVVATGRKPNIQNLNLSSIGVDYDRKGIKTNKYLQTNVKNIYAAGDVVPPYQFTHVADYEAVVATGNAFLPFNRAVDYDGIGWCTFTSPELARFGLTEDEAKAEYGEKIRVYRYDLSSLDRAVTDIETKGMAKYVTDKKGRLLGAHILSENAGEVIHEAMLAKKMKLPFHKIAKMIHIYPTYSYLVRQPSKYAAIDILLENPIVKFFRGFKK